MNMRLFSPLVVLSLVIMALSSCDPQRLYDDNKLIAGDKWYYKDAVPFDVQVTDTTKLYNVYVNLRIDADYKYNNIFMWVNTTNPEKKTDQRRVDIRLADDGGK